MGSLRVGLLGAGNIAIQHLEAAKLVADRLTIEAICDTDRQALDDRASRYNIGKRYTNIADLLADDDLDMIIVLTPPHIRQQVVVPCLDAGKHVLVEKPFALTLSEARNMVEAAERNQRWIAVNQNYRWRPEVMHLRSLLDTDAIGKILMINMNQSTWRDEGNGWRNTTDYLAVSVMGVHWLDRFRWLTKDEACSVYSSLATSGLLSSRGEDIVSITVRFGSGAVATLTHSWVSRARSEADYTEIIGTKGTVVMQGQTTRLHLAGTNEVREWQFHDANVFVHSFAESLSVFTQDIQNNRPSCISGRDNLLTMALVDGAYHSSQTNSVIHLNTEGKDVHQE